MSPTGSGSPPSIWRTERADGRQFGFTALGSRFKVHIDGCLVAGPVALAYPEANVITATSCDESFAGAIVFCDAYVGEILRSALGIEPAK